MKLMKTSQKFKEWETIINNVVFYAEDQIRYGSYDRSEHVFIQYMSDGSQWKFDEREVEEWFRVLYK